MRRAPTDARRAALWRTVAEQLAEVLEEMGCEDDNSPLTPLPVHRFYALREKEDRDWVA